MGMVSVSPYLGPNRNVAGELVVVGGVHHKNERGLGIRKRRVEGMGQHI